MPRIQAALLAFALAAGCEGTSPQDPAESPSPRDLSTKVASISADALRGWTGDLSDLPPPERAAFEAAPEDFPPLRVPGADDWRAQHEEDPQTFGSFVLGERNTPGADGRDRIYILPLGDVPLTEELRRYGHGFFALPVTVLPPVDITEESFTRRMNGTHAQVLAGDIQAYLQQRLPTDAYALIGLTVEDLYPGEDWNYVFGLASVSKRTGVFSFARYDPRFYDSAASVDDKLLERRAFKILTHEIGHMFGLTHCMHFSCNMNGANHAEELDRSPPHLCPVCLRKLQFATGFSTAGRYDNLRAQYEEMGWGEAAEFVGRRQQHIASALSSPRSSPPPQSR